MTPEHHFLDTTKKVAETSSGEQVASDALFGLFVTATLKNGKNGEPRQGWIINCNPLIIRGESGTVYACEGEPVVVEPQPPTPNQNQTL